MPHQAWILNQIGKKKIILGSGNASPTNQSIKYTLFQKPPHIYSSWLQPGFLICPFLSITFNRHKKRYFLKQAKGI